MKAILMAGGEGTRLRPLTCAIPKPMVPILNKPVLEHILEHIRPIGFNKIDVTTCYLPDCISDYFRNKSFGGADLPLSFRCESVPLGTGGSVLNTGLGSNETIVVLSGDCVTDLNLGKAIEFHRKNHSQATLVLKRMQFPLDYGIVIVDQTGRIVRFLEKPAWGEVFSDTVNTGIYILEPDIFRFYNPGDRFDFSKDLFPKLLAEDIPMYGYISDQYWNDVGDLNSYRQTQFDLLDQKIKSTKLPAEISPGVYVGENTIISPTAILHPPVLIGSGCRIGDHVLLDSYNIIGDHTLIEEHSTLKRSILWDHVTVGRNVHCRGTILCSDVSVEDHANLFENSVVGTHSTIQSNVQVSPEIKIWPGKIIEKNHIVSSNLVWGTTPQRLKFIDNSISGVVNHDLSPEFATTLGSLYSGIIKSKDPLLVSIDDSSLAEYIKTPVITGILSTGRNVVLVDRIITPISRYCIVDLQCAGGIHISSDSVNKRSVRLEFLDSKGGNIERRDQREMDNLLSKGGLNRCNADQLLTTSVTEIHRYDSVYKGRYSSRLNAHTAQNTNLHSVLIITPARLTANLSKEFLEAQGFCVTIHIDSALSGNADELSRKALLLAKQHPFDIGFAVNENGESFTLFDSTGFIFSNDSFRLFTAKICVESGNCECLVVPVDSPDAMSKMAESMNIKIHLVHSNITDTLNSMLRCDSSKACSDLRLQQPLQLELQFNILLSSVHILHYLTARKWQLSDAARELPEFHVKKQKWECSFERRGFILRKLIEEYSGSSVELFEGIKINSNEGWTLILPDNNMPVFEILSEGQTEEIAEELCLSMNEVLNRLHSVYE